MRRPARWALLALLALPVLVALVVGCAQGQQAASSPGDATTAAPTSAAVTSTTADEDFVARPADFVHLKDMTAVRGFFLANPAGHLDQALAVANSPAGGVYPVGTIIQLVPLEAMVKRRAGFDPASNDWEFFELTATPEGTRIDKRGGSEVVNHFGGGSCAGCHKRAEAKFDFICEQSHGCESLPFGQDVFKKLQEADPRPRTTATQPT